MLPKLVRAAGLLGLLFAVSAPPASGATPKEVERALKAGSDALKARYKGGAPAAAVGGDGQGLGATCLAGLALLEAGVPVDDPAVKAITGTVREACYTQTGTYQIALCLMYLDRYGDPADVLRIQILGVRLLVGQTVAGGWSYQCCAQPSADDVKWLKALRADQGPGKLHPDVEKYGQALAAGRNAVGGGTGGADDNSNTQFGVLAVWMARKHGVPVENALELIEKRFVGSQDPRTGNWSYSGGAAAGMGVGSPSMYCAGLLGMATAVARREEKRKGETPAKPKPKVDPAKPSDPFYNPPAAAPPPKKEDARPTDTRDATVQRAFAGLGLTIADQIRGGKGLLFDNGTGGHGHGDLYFLWSVERVGVIYGVDKIGGFDWYDIGSTALVRSQANDGTWNLGSYGVEVNTAFAVLFLARSNLARDLSGKVQKDPVNTEMRAGAGSPATDLLPTRPAPAAAPVLDLPNPTGDEAIALASKLLKSSGADWSKLLASTRDAKGANNTRALVVLANNVDGDRKKAVRDALAERLCRMTPTTLRAMLQANEAELRRAAALACAMKDDKDHIPDLVAAMSDGDGSVVRAAKAGLKSLTGKDFATAAEWRDWLSKEKK
ncbi:MAG: hypothetical protein J0I06_22135 [Planctomycetes bacterium]|nr:hypothetical protein [Planctomycetota bacterium]